MVHPRAAPRSTQEAPPVPNLAAPPTGPRRSDDPRHRRVRLRRDRRRPARRRPRPRAAPRPSRHADRHAPRRLPPRRARPAATAGPQTGHIVRRRQGLRASPCPTAGRACRSTRRRIQAIIDGLPEGSDLRGRPRSRRSAPRPSSRSRSGRSTSVRSPDRRRLTPEHEHHRPAGHQRSTCRSSSRSVKAQLGAIDGIGDDREQGRHAPGRRGAPPRLRARRRRTRAAPTTTVSTTQYYVQLPDQRRSSSRSRPSRAPTRCGRRLRGDHRDRCEAASPVSRRRPRSRPSVSPAARQSSANARLRLERRRPAGREADDPVEPDRGERRRGGRPVPGPASRTSSSRV